MKNYTVYFEIYGIKKRVKIQAHNKNQAIGIVKNDLKIHKVEEDNPEPFTDWTEANEIAEFLGIKK